MAGKKTRKTFDSYVGVLLVVPASVRVYWKVEAEKAGLDLSAWAMTRLGIREGTAPAHSRRYSP